MRQRLESIYSAPVQVIMGVGASGCTNSSFFRFFGCTSAPIGACSAPAAPAKIGTLRRINRYFTAWIPPWQLKRRSLAALFSIVEGGISITNGFKDSLRARVCQKEDLSILERKDWNQRILPINLAFFHQTRIKPQ